MKIVCARWMYDDPGCLCPFCSAHAPIRILRRTRTRRGNNGVSIGPSVRRRIYLRDGFLCQVPGCPTPNVTVPPDERSLDHIVRWRDGGDNRQENLRLAHQRCNSSRDKMERRLADA